MEAPPKSNGERDILSLTPAFLQRKPSGHSVSLLHSAP